jgi:HK97 gp10 family phage protein
MTDGVSFKLEGMDEILGKLKELSHDVKYRGGRFALRKAANLVATKAKENAKTIDDPATAEDISKNIAVRWSGRTFKTTGDLKFRVGVMGGARQYANTRDNVRAGRAGASYAVGGDKSNPGGDTFYWRFLEFGTERTRAQPFMRRALSENVSAAVAEFSKEFPKAIDRALKRAQKAK